MNITGRITNEQPNPREMNFCEISFFRGPNVYNSIAQVFTLRNIVRQYESRDSVSEVSKLYTITNFS